MSFVASDHQSFHFKVHNERKRYTDLGVSSLEQFDRLGEFRERTPRDLLRRVKEVQHELFLREKWENKILTRRRLPADFLVRRTSLVGRGKSFDQLAVESTLNARILGQMLENLKPEEKKDVKLRLKARGEAATYPAHGCSG